MRILLPVDGSKNSTEAATAIPHLSEAEEVIALYVLDLPHVTYPIGRPELDLAVPLKVEEAMRDDGERLLQRVLGELPAEAGSVTTRLESGSPAQTIVAVAEKDGVDLIVIGARGLSQLQEWMLGGVSHQVVSHAHCPVLLVKQPVRKIQRVLLPIQGNEDADMATHFLSKMPFRSAPEITALSVLPFHEPLWPGGLAEGLEHSEKATLAVKSFLADLVKNLVDLKYPATSKAVMGRPATAILEQLEAGGYDLVIMGSRGRTGLKKLVLGSVSTAVVHRTKTPVLVLR